MNSASKSDYHKHVLYLIIGIMVFRTVGLIFSPLGLHGDEAQYWAWSKDLDWGYFTKPPMIAWIIALTTSLFGDAEWAIRISSPILHAVTAYIIYRAARFLYDGLTGFWAVVLYFLMPALWLSSGIVSTDVPLLLCWATALNAWAHLRERPVWPRYVQLSLAFGLGMLCKYAMLFFLPALGLAFLFDGKSRKALNSIKGYGAGALSLLVISPNIIWNINHDFATLSHTVANANIQNEIPFHPDELLTFWGDQLFIFGPITLAILIFALIAAFKRRLDAPSVWVALFAVSPLAIISFEALISRANANWAVTAYVAASILTAHYGVKFWQHGETRFKKVRTWMKAGAGLNIIMGLALATITLAPSLANAIGSANSFKRLRAWPETVQVLEQRLEEGHEGRAFTVVAADKRIIFYDLLYYGLAEKAPLKMWMHQTHPVHHAELTSPLPKQDGPVLVINYYPNYVDEMRADFEQLIPLEPLEIDLGGGKTRQWSLWAGYGYTPTQTR